jgi:ribonucleoside-diphosphate reductase alpha chain
VQEIEDLYVQSWRYGLKAVALYRDGSKGSQPLNSQSDTAKKEAEEDAGQLAAQQLAGTAPVPVTLKVADGAKALAWGERHTLPRRRMGFTLEATVAGHKLFMRTGEYQDKQLGEIFIDMYKEGASYRSLMNAFAQAVSVGLSYGVPLEKYVNMYTFTRFEPYGMTDHPNVRTCTSIVDFIFRILGMEYLGRTDLVHVQPSGIDLRSDGSTQDGQLPAPQTAAVITQQHPIPGPFPAGDSGAAGAARGRESNPVPGAQARGVPHDAMDEQLAELMGDAPVCDVCGHLTVRNGTCYRCLNCGNSMGCS